MTLKPRQTRLLVALGIAISLSLPGDQTLYVALPTRADQVGLGVGAVGVLLGVNRLVRVAANPIAGRLYDRSARRRLFLTGMLLGTISTSVYVVADRFWIWLVGRLVWGMAWSLLNVGGLAMVMDVTDVHDRGKVTGFYGFWYLVGLAFSPLLGGLLADALGFRSALLVGAILTGIGLVLAALMVPETKAEPTGQDGRAGVGRPKRTGTLSDRVKGIDRRLLALSYIYFVTFFSVNGVVMSTVSLYLNQTFGETISLVGAAIGVASIGGMLLALRSVAGMISGPLSGYLSDRAGDRWPVVRLGIVLGALGLGALAGWTSIWVVVVAVLLVSACSATLMTTVVALTGDLTTGGGHGAAMGTLAAAGDLGSATGPLLAYGLLQLVGLRYVYLLCGVLFLSILLVVRVVTRSRVDMHVAVP
jgi:MFS family permease